MLARIGLALLTLHLLLPLAPGFNGWGAFRPWGEELLLLSVLGYGGVLWELASMGIQRLRRRAWKGMLAVWTALLFAGMAAFLSILPQLTSNHGDHVWSIVIGYAMCALAVTISEWQKRADARQDTV